MLLCKDRWTAGSVQPDLAPFGPAWCRSALFNRNQAEEFPAEECLRAELWFISALHPNSAELHMRQTASCFFIKHHEFIVNHIWPACHLSHIFQTLVYSVCLPIRLFTRVDFVFLEAVINVVTASGDESNTVLNHSKFKVLVLYCFLLTSQVI